MYKKFCSLYRIHFDICVFSSIRQHPFTEFSSLHSLYGDRFNPLFCKYGFECICENKNFLRAFNKSLFWMSHAIIPTYYFIWSYNWHLAIHMTLDYCYSYRYFSVSFIEPLIFGSIKIHLWIVNMNFAVNRKYSILTCHENYNFFYCYVQVHFSRIVDFNKRRKFKFISNDLKMKHNNQQSCSTFSIKKSVSIE